jgi:hypothetical protein
VARQLRWRSLKPCRKKSGEARKAKGQKGRGSGGSNFCPFAIRNRAFPLFSDQEKHKTEKLSFPFKRKIAREKIKKCRENFSVLVPPKRSGGKRKRTSFLFWIFFEKSSDFVQSSEP